MRRQNNEYYIIKEYKNKQLPYFIKLLNITLFL